MIDSFFTAYIIYFVVINPIGSAPIFLAVNEAQDRARKLRTALESTTIATAIMLFFALCGAYILAYLNITEAAFKIAGGDILFLVALNASSANALRGRWPATPATRTQGETDCDNLAIYPLAIPLLVGPSAIMSVIVVNAGFLPACFQIH